MNLRFNALLRDTLPATSPAFKASPLYGQAVLMLGWTLLVSAAAGCKGRAAAETAPVVQAPAAAVSTQAALAPTPVAAPVSVSWDASSKWKSLPPSSAMRKATYQVPPATGDKEPAELAVFYFGVGQGGSVDANITRWLGQFSGVDAASVQRKEQEYGGFKTHLVEIPSGTYTDSMAAMHGGTVTAKDNFALLGAIVETPVGPYFFKLTGPKATVGSAKADFVSLLQSIKTGH